MAEKSKARASRANGEELALISSTPSLVGRRTASRIPPGHFIWFIGLSVNLSHLAELRIDLGVFVGRLGSIVEAQGFEF